VIARRRASAAGSPPPTSRVIHPAASKQAAPAHRVLTATPLIVLAAGLHQDRAMADLPADPQEEQLGRRAGLGAP